MRTKSIRIITVIWLVGFAFSAEATEDFLIPGVDFSKLDLREGAWCRYLVIDEALGQVDSTEIYVGVPEAVTTVEGPAFWIELSSTVLGAGIEGTEVLKLLVLERITRFSEGDSLGDYVLKLYIRRGARPAEEEDPKEYEDFSMIVPTADSTWVTSPGVPVSTKGGEFTCTKKTRSVQSEREIPTGKIKLVKRARDGYTVWFCSEIPVFRMAKCVIERMRETETIPRITGIPAPGKKESKTAAELTGYGFDAKPILSIDDSNR
ncbi:MAG: hypothetical protein JSW58_02805 [Candidatus Latescibacterota bacterium]|nr:MAG: hypothetical protein JSW58_02805 [Candidatus Latescibacterota bacterium]